MKYLKKSNFLLNFFLFLSGCSGSGIGTESKNPSQYFGCYTYNGVPILYIGAENVRNIQDGKITNVNGFYKIRSSNFLLTKNQIIFGKNGELKFTARDSGFQYEFRRGSSPPVLLLYDESGREIDLIRGDDVC